MSIATQRQWEDIKNVISAIRQDDDLDLQVRVVPISTGCRVALWAYYQGPQHQESLSRTVCFHEDDDRDKVQEKLQLAFSELRAAVKVSETAARHQSRLALLNELEWTAVGFDAGDYFIRNGEVHASSGPVLHRQLYVKDGCVRLRYRNQEVEMPIQARWMR